jgi:predicted TPR repeat methyltransferase
VNTDQTLRHFIDAHKAGRLDEAESGYRSLLATHPDDTEVLNMLGMLCCSRGEHESGLRFLRRAVDGAPRNPRPLLNYGNGLLVHGELEAATQAFEQAVRLSPTWSGAWSNLGLCRIEAGRMEDAAFCLVNALFFDSDNLSLYKVLADVFLRLRRYKSAAETFRDWLDREPENPYARYMLAAAVGDPAATPERAPAAYVEALFNSFASTFDEVLAELNYEAPRILADRLRDRLGADARADILDAGCGTGLCGVLLRPMARYLAGVDISSSMIARAREHKLYDALEVSELSTFMRSKPSLFDAVVSADVLVYFGALEEPLACAFTCLRTGGVLLASLERLDDPSGDGPPWRLQQHGRYCHTEAYLQQAFRKAGFKSVSCEQAVLRREGGADVLGNVMTAVK